MYAKVNVIPNPKGKVKAFASITLDQVALTIYDIRVIEGKNGLFIALPSRSYEEDGETRYKSVVYVSDETLYNEIESCVLDEYEKATTHRKGGRR